MPIDTAQNKYGCYAIHLWADRFHGAITGSAKVWSMRCHALPVISPWYGDCTYYQ